MHIDTIIGKAFGAQCADENAISYSFAFVVTDKLPRETLFLSQDTNFFSDGCGPVISSIDDSDIDEIEFAKNHQSSHNFTEGKELSGVSVLQSLSDIKKSWLPKAINQSELTKLI